MEKIIRFFEKPYYEGLEKLCKKYLELLENLWSFADTDEIRLIDETLNEVLIRKKMGDSPKKFINSTESQIKDYFNNEKVEVYENISPNITDMWLKKINRFLSDNKIFVENLGLIYPDSGQLDIRQNYVNYIFIKQILPSLEIRAGKGFK
ncbi:MAG: hypothetical protein GX265_05490 [Mollicutes bacterium]|nr:hypothetical protein [Mollicutes bacterium]